MNIQLGTLIHAFADTLDLVGIDDFHHGKRVGFMARECAKQLGFSSERQVWLYRAGLLHDCGVSSTRVHKHLVDELDWKDSHIHCEIGAERLGKFEPLADYSETIRYHHTRWGDLSWKNLAEEVKDFANLIFLADRIDALAALAPGTCRLACSRQVCQKIESLKGSYFKSHFVDAILACAEKEAFWISQENENLRSYLQTYDVDRDDVTLDDRQLKNMARLFADVVDAKSPYTAEHSVGVATLSRYLAQCCQLPEQTLTRIEAAGLMHDLGKLKISDSILESPGPLEGDSLVAMRHHSYMTFIILNRISGLEEITRWASEHHEKLDGSGYPFHKTAADLSVESRIVMIADIFQALAQNRPYRRSLQPEDIVDIIKKQVQQGKLDAEIFRIVEMNKLQCYEAALQRIEEN